MIESSDRSRLDEPTAQPQKRTSISLLGRLHVPRLALLDAVGAVRVTTDAKADPRQWLPGEHPVTELLQLPSDLAPGDYALTVALMDPAGQHRPFRLAMDVPEKEGRYTVGRLQVK